MPQAQDVSGSTLGRIKSASQSAIASAAESISSSAKDVASNASDKLNSAAVQATNHVKQSMSDTIQSVKNEASAKLNNVTSEANNNIRDLKSFAQESSANLDTKTRGFMSSFGARIKQSAVLNLNRAGDRIKDSLGNVAQSTKERMKNELNKRIPKISFPKLTDASAISKEASQTITQSSKTLTQSTNAANLASKVLTESTARAASNMTSQVQQSVQKTSRWLWWWGLAAVGVYGMSTTLTKEGVGVLKNLISGGRVEEDEGNTVSSAGTPASSNSSKAVSVNESGDEAVRNGWLSSIKRYFWIGKRSNE